MKFIDVTKSLKYKVVFDKDNNETLKILDGDIVGSFIFEGCFYTTRFVKKSVAQIYNFCKDGFLKMINYRLPFSSYSYTSSFSSHSYVSTSKCTISTSSTFNNGKTNVETIINGERIPQSSGTFYLKDGTCVDVETIEVNNGNISIIMN